MPLVMSANCLYIVIHYVFYIMCYILCINTLCIIYYDLQFEIDYLFTYYPLLKGLMYNKILIWIFPRW